LGKDARVADAARVEDRVEVDVDEVVEVGEVGGGDRVAGAVGVGERVQEGVQRALLVGGVGG